MSEGPSHEPRYHTPEEIAVMLGGISVKTLNDLVRDRSLEITTLGYAPRHAREVPAAASGA